MLARWPSEQYRRQAGGISIVELTLLSPIFHSNAPHGGSTDHTKFYKPCVQSDPTRQEPYRSQRNKTK